MAKSWLSLGLAAPICGFVLAGTSMLVLVFRWLPLSLCPVLIASALAWTVTIPWHGEVGHFLLFINILIDLR
jgi:hypothetical protein